MKRSIAMSATMAALILTSAAAVGAQTTQTSPTTQDTTAAASTDQTATAQLSDKDQKALDRCKAMTEAQRAQSSKCTTLMKQSGDAPKKNDLMRESALRH